MTLSQTHVGMEWRPARTPARAAPAGLPLPPVDLTVPVWAADIAPDKPWPPTRLEEATDRLETLWAAGRSDYSRWADIPMPTGRWESLVDDYQTVLGDHPPTPPAGVDELALGAAIRSAARNLLAFGSAVMLDEMGVPISPDRRFIWPLGDRPDSWVQAELMIAPDATSPTPTSIVLWIITGGVRWPLRFGWSGDTTTSLASGQLGEQLPAPPPRMCRGIGLRHGTTAGGAGEPLLEQLLPLIVRIERRDAITDYILDRSGRPVFTVEVESHSAAQTARALGRPVADGDNVTPEMLQELAGDLRDHDTITLVDGLKNPKYVTFDGALDSSFAFRQMLEAEWTRKTGQAATEGGDSGDIGSGVAYARRQAKLIAHIQDMHAILDAGLRRLWPMLLWPWVNAYGEQAIPPTGPQPAIEPPAAMPGAV